MRSRAYYNEIDPFAAQWLRNLIAAGLVSPGDVDDRDIRSVQPDDLRGYQRVHFFAGIAGWDHALDLAGWGDRPVWTGSCPCQPFSVAGRRGGLNDDRHLWPVWFRLIRECRPAIVFGEQVEAAVRHGWLDAVFADLEGEAYACGAAVLGAHSVGAPHIRQRLWFMAHAGGERRDGEPALLRRADPSGWDEADYPEADRNGAADGAVAHASEQGRCDRSVRAGGPLWGASPETGRLCDAGRLGHAHGDDAAQERARHEVVGGERAALGWRPVERAGAGATGRACGGVGADRAARAGHGPDAGTVGHWSDVEWLPCRDGKARPTRPGLQPLAHGVSGRVGKLRAAGNAIVSEVASDFIKACRELIP